LSEQNNLQATLAKQFAVPILNNMNAYVYANKS